jgi:hypothetical protein
MSNNTTHTAIPKILHQLWIGDQTKRPVSLMETWRLLHPDWEYIAWDEAEIARRGLTFECARQIQDIPEINGKADIMRWEILNSMGGVFMDADSVCLEPLDDDIFLTKSGGFSCFENEQNRRGLVACGAMGFPKGGNQLSRDIIDHIKTLDLRPQVCNLKAWMTVAVTLITQKLETGKYPDFTVFPSYMFIPHHFTGAKYQGHKRVYAYQAWGSTYHNYQVLNGLSIPADLLPPQRNVSILISSYNTPAAFVRDCLDSIRAQTAHIGFEIVWMNDGSDAAHTTGLRAELARFEREARFCRISYHENAENRGIAVALHEGVRKCSHELIFKMDSDDIMAINRVARQIEFMDAHPTAPMCGANIQFFGGAGGAAPPPTNHPREITWDGFCKNPSPWFLNHPTMCVRKSAVLKVGNYNTSLTKKPFEDFDLEIRMLRDYKKIYNLPDVLLNYRLHSGQVTHQMNAEPAKWSGLRAQIIQAYVGGAATSLKMQF